MIIKMSDRLRPVENAFCLDFKIICIYSADCAALIFRSFFQAAEQVEPALGATVPIFSKKQNSSLVNNWSVLQF